MGICVKFFQKLLEWNSVFVHILNFIGSIGDIALVPFLLVSRFSWVNEKILMREEGLGLATLGSCPRWILEFMREEVAAA